MTGSHPLQTWRVGQGLSRQALGKELGVSGVTIGRWESGTRKVDLALVPKVARKTGIAPRDLRPDWAEVLEAAE
jgi:transcriptional regulator with XRE-family HTH domain